MTVYVDDMYKTPLGRLGRMKMSHVIADTEEELVAAMEAVGVHRRHHQFPGTPASHFDVAMSKRSQLIANGAVPITMRELAAKIRDRRQK